MNLNLDWVPALSTSALTITAFVAIIFCFTKFGVFSTIIDKLGSGKAAELRELKNNALIIQESVSELKQQVQLLVINDNLYFERMSSLEGKFLDIQLESFKKSIYDGKIPICERFGAGLRYLRAGGNSVTQDFLLKKLALENVPAWNELCRAMDLKQYCLF